MTEKDIIKALECCNGNGSCDTCAFNGKKDCIGDLKQSAVKVIQLQQNAVEQAADTIARLQRDNRAMQSIVRYEFTHEELVRSVNNIISNCMDRNEDEYCGDSYMGVINAIEGFINTLKSKDCYIGIFPGRDAPQILFKNKKAE